MVLVRFFSHAGHIRVGASGDDFGSGAVLKFIETRDFKDNECLFSGEEAGHRGDSF